MGVFLIILLILALLWPYIMRWMRGYLMRKAEDRLRQMMGAPPRQEERRQDRQRRDDSRRGDTRRRRSNPHPAQAMKEVAGFKAAADLKIPEPERSSSEHD